jgi:hypothetical protein
MIDGFFCYAMDGMGSEKVEILYYEFINSGKRLVTMSSFGGIFKRGQYSKGYSQFIVNVPGLPKKLEPGDRFQVTFTEFGSIDEFAKAPDAESLHTMATRILFHTSIRKS